MGSSGAPRLRSRLRNTLVMMVKSQAFSFVPGLKRFRYRYARKYVSCTRSSASSGFRVRRSALRYNASRCLSKSEKSLLMATPRWSILFRRIRASGDLSLAPARYSAGRHQTAGRSVAGRVLDLGRAAAPGGLQPARFAPTRAGGVVGWAVREDAHPPA